MPTLKDYRCPECENETEAMTDLAVICDNCGCRMEVTFRKAPPVRYKGTGFYSTDKWDDPNYKG